MPDLLVVGGGVTGLALAVHAARADLDVALVEAGALGGTSTQRSGALVRTHYDEPGSAALALRGLEHFETFAERYGGPAGFAPTGFAYVPEAHEVADGSFAARVAMLQRTGVETSAIGPDELCGLDPGLRIDDAGVAAYEPRSGYADPAQTTATLAAAARAAGALLRSHTAVTALRRDGAGAVVGARLDDGIDLTATATVLCAGAWSAELTAAAGLALPLQPTAVKLALIRRAVPAHLTVIDAPNGTYFRPDGAHATLVGRRTWTDEPLRSAGTPLPPVDAEFLADAAERLARRLPSAAGSPVLGGRAGMLDMTPDGLPLVGPSELAGLWLCCGWSGTGFKTGPAVGEVLAGWIAGGGPAPAELAAFGPGREPRTPASVRSPH